LVQSPHQRSIAIITAHHQYTIKSEEKNIAFTVTDMTLKRPTGTQFGSLEY
jgi:hypothetical protein